MAIKANNPSRISSNGLNTIAALNMAPDVHVTMFAMN